MPQSEAIGQRQGERAWLGSVFVPADRRPRSGGCNCSSFEELNSLGSSTTACASPIATLAFADRAWREGQLTREVLPEQHGAATQEVAVGIADKQRRVGSTRHGKRQDGRDLTGGRIEAQERAFALARADVRAQQNRAAVWIGAQPTDVQL